MGGGWTVLPPVPVPSVGRQFGRSAEGNPGRVDASFAARKGIFARKILVREHFGGGSVSKRVGGLRNPDFG